MKAHKPPLERLRKQIFEAEQKDKEVQAIHLKMKISKARRLKSLTDKLKEKQTKQKRIQLEAQKREIQKEPVASERSRAYYALRRIKAQYPDSAEGSLMFEILKGAVFDLFSPDADVIQAAAKYLNALMIHAQLCDVEAAWIRKILTQAHLHINARILV